MDFSENWKSFFPVSISPSSPILIPSSARPTLGPLIFNPIPETLTHVFSSSSLLPPPLHIPQLSLSRLLITSCPDAPVLPSTASSIASHCGPQFQNDIASILQCNRLEFLKYGNSVIVFFPTGVNSEKVGFLILHVEGSSLHLQLDGNGDIFRATSGESYSISRILVNPIDDEEDDLASNAFLLLCDVRKHMMPIIRWAHGLDRPCFMNVLNLSMLRSHSREDTFKSASEVGFCIILGSFWHGMFNLFFYGPSLPSQRGSLASKLSKTSKTFYAWELPHEIVLSGRDCLCGSCLLKEELSKAALPEWIDWQMKKEMVLGFGIMNNDLASLLCEPYKYGGFTLVRLMSSGKLELQRYEASWVHDRKLEDCHEQGLRLDKYLLFTVGDEKYKYRKSVVFHKLNFINAYRRGNLTEFLVKKLKDPCMDDQEMGPFDVDVHEFLCEKLNACGVGPFRSSPAIIAFFKDVKPSANLHDVALRRLWAELPLDLLQLAFSKHSESLDVAIDQKKTTLEFLAVPSCPELPPFFLRKSSSCSNKGSNKAQRDGDIMGPILPLPILLVLHEIYDGCSDLEDGKFSVEAEVDIKYNEIMKVAAAISVSISGSESSGNYEVSLADDANETWVDPSKLKPFLLYRPAALNCSGTNLVYENSIYRGKIHDTLIFHVLEEKTVSNDKSESELVGPEIFDDLCLVDLRFNAPSKKFEGGGLKAFDVLKRQLSKWQEGVDSYKELTVQSGFLKPVSK
ncbi:uncharacterized protein LOC114726630 isoform X2 [Neltuma alba]|uniref:uncharacterized protein LOC114726630 isoform X2 n=1 Tax=Neltuma alba TaxID=207710 RepID=UPI0010A3E8CE|nr:uncharacterized protein LOC114726630 isoform X2 [Prosopis alba]